MSQSPTAQEITSNLEQMVSLILHTWPALTHAVSEGWGSNSPSVARDKRDWLAGAVVELITPDPLPIPRADGNEVGGKSPLTDPEDLEEVLMQVMLDEFEVVVDDGSPGEVAGRIWRGRDKVLKGDFAEVHEMYRKWRERKGEVAFTKVEDQDAQETDWDGSTSGDDEEEQEWNGFQDGDAGDAQMDEAPPLVEGRREKYQPEIDEEGFTKVVRKKR